jgi:hypothetical protein
MDRIFRTILSLALSLWVGAEFFFPFVAATVFSVLRPDTHTAGIIVGRLLTTLHILGLLAGILCLAILVLQVVRYRDLRAVIRLRLALIAVAVLLTLYSQFGITPWMERDRLAAGGMVDLAPANLPAVVEFKSLHKQSEAVEGGIALLGLASILVLNMRRDSGTKR